MGAIKLDTSAYLFKLAHTYACNSHNTTNQMHHRTLAALKHHTCSNTPPHSTKPRDSSLHQDFSTITGE